MKKVDRDNYEQTFGLFKFKRPYIKDLESAMGLAGESSHFKKMIMGNYKNFYDIIKPPEEGDWLMKHKEFGQTYEEYVKNGCSQVELNRDTIYITPLAFNKDNIMDQDFILSIFLLCESYFYGMKVRLIQMVSDYGTIEAKYYDDKNLRINGEQFLNKLAEDLPEDAFCLVGIIDIDFYKKTIDKNGKVYLNIVHSVRDISKRTGIISLSKFFPINSIDISKISKVKKQKIYMIVLKRICKAITSEICSLFGMKNCTFFCCNMNGVGNLTELDDRPFELCPICLRKLITSINCKGEDIKSFRMKNPSVVYYRFVKLKEALQENFFGIFDSEIAWYNLRLDYLKNEI